MAVKIYWNPTVRADQQFKSAGDTFTDEELKNIENWASQNSGYSYWGGSDDAVYYKRDRGTSRITGETPNYSYNSFQAMADAYTSKWGNQGWSVIDKAEYDARNAVQAPGISASAADIASYEQAVKAYMANLNQSALYNPEYRTPDQSPEAVAERTSEFQAEYDAKYGEGAYEAAKEKGDIPEMTETLKYPEYIYTTVDGKQIDPTKYTNLEPGTTDFDNWLEENNIKKISTSDSEVSSDMLSSSDNPDLLAESNKMNAQEEAELNKEYYGNKRNLDTEKLGAQDLADFLDSKTVNGKTLRQTITSEENWYKYVNAYVYGGYTMQDIANDLYSRATGSGGGIVHPSIKRSEWFSTQQGQLPGQETTVVDKSKTVTQDSNQATIQNDSETKPAQTSQISTESKSNTITTNPTAGGVSSDETFDWEALNTKISDLQTQYLDRKSFYEGELERIKNMTGSQSAINKELTKVNQEMQKELADIELRQSIAQGNWDRARAITQENKEALYQDFEVQMSMIEAGYIPATDEMIADLDPTQYITAPDGKSYIKDTTGTALDYVNVDNWAKNILDGSASLSNVPEEMRTAVNNQIKTLLDTGYVALTPEQKDNLGKLSGSLRQEPMYRDMLDILNGYKSVEVGYGLQNGFGDLTMINGFQRMIDPGAVVREGEFKTVADAQGWLQKVLNLPGQIIEGDKLRSEGRKSLYNAAKELYNAKAASYNQLVGTQYKARSEAYDLPYDLVGQDFPIEGEYESIEDVWEFDSGSSDSNSDYDTIYDIFA